ncbi:AI-2E family transporter [Halobaculum gomorrense]|uniref:Predicted PurR-regulated permease PerM n=1 Tax=Halobaculum gomorrense TaxID=43928 RepID=A0A1M5JJ83_9EURY|nr:AI-2E family transporter [Halobaculum gomorrense]SHG40103.1 Predicted PurR-regulated permease PerM [Halobaculum gomorrense]
MDLRTPERSRRLWLAAAVVAVGVVGLFVYSFVGTLVFGLFVYYGARPIRRAVERRVDDRSVAATLTMLALVLPLLVLVGYAGVVAFREFATVVGPDAVQAVLSRLPGDPRSVSAVLRDPRAFLRRLDRLGALREQALAVVRTAGAAAGAVLHLTLSLSLAFFLLRDDERVAAWARGNVAGEESSAYALARAVDADLERVYIGNVATVFGVTVAALVVYNGYNALVAPAVALPVPTLLALLTGLATFVPIVVGKLVYVPAGAYLLREAAVSDAGFAAPLAFLVVSFLLLDVLPQTVVRPLLSGRTLHDGLILFAYVLGAALFGWYGLFFGPLLAVVVVQVAAHAFPHVITGEPVDAGGADVGTDPTTGDGERAAGDGSGAGGADAETPERSPNADS